MQKQIRPHVIARFHLSKLTSQSGQSLIEVMVAIVVVTMVMVGLLSAITVSLANTQFAKNKAQATKYADEAMEWLRGQRDSMSWNDFYILARDQGSTQAPYCVSTLTFAITTDCPVIDDDLDIYTRTVQLTKATDAVNIEIIVAWQQGERNHDVTLNSILTKWQ